jgi:hypothetical protein
METDDTDNLPQLIWKYGSELSDDELLEHASCGSVWRVRTPGGILHHLRWDGLERGWVEYTMQGGIRVFGPLLHQRDMRNAQFVPVDDAGEVVL